MDDAKRKEIEVLKIRMANCARDPLEDWIREYVEQADPWNAPQLLQRANEIKSVRELALRTMEDQIERLKAGE